MAMDDIPAALAPPDDVEPNFANPPNMNGLANGLLISAFIVAFLAVLVRIHYWIVERSYQKQLKGKIEAVLVMSGFASYIGFVYALLHVAQIETGWWVHQWDVTIDGKARFSYWVYIAQVLYNSSIGPVKVAILIEWTRIFSPQSRNAFFWLCHLLLWLNVLYYISSIIVESVRCTPRRSIWNPTVKGKCLPDKAVEIIFSINVTLDLLLLLAPQLVIWRPKPSAAKGSRLMIDYFGIIVSIGVGLFGSIAAIFRLVTTQASSKSLDSTYTSSPTYFWALGELTSVFVVYGLPAVPTAIDGVLTVVHRCYARCTQLFLTGRAGDSSDARDHSPWRRARLGANRRYRNLDRNSFPMNAATTQCISTYRDQDPSILPETVSVVRTVEVRSDEIRAGKLGELDRREIGQDVLLRQHPWFKLG
ncbi:hypothetical protein F4808DRAFT_460360 [Astrocystis sublimbata]|nr:hypothetical protein F4808DRAFT_460360 [Astrocystis sublimbata]